MVCAALFRTVCSEAERAGTPRTIVGVAGLADCAVVCAADLHIDSVHTEWVNSFFRIVLY